jgi:hypothetical protein
MSLSRLFTGWLAFSSGVALVAAGFGVGWAGQIPTGEGGEGCSSKCRNVIEVCNIAGEQSFGEGEGNICRRHSDPVAYDPKEFESPFENDGNFTPDAVTVRVWKIGGQDWCGGVGPGWTDDITPSGGVQGSLGNMRFGKCEKEN